MHLPCTESTASNSMPSGKRHVTEILTWQRPCEVVHISGVQSSQRHTLQINIKTLAHMLLATLNVAQPVAISQTEWITSFRNYLQPLNCTPMCMHRHTKFLFNWPSFPELLQLWLYIKTEPSGTTGDDCNSYRPDTHSIIQWTVLKWNSEAPSRESFTTLQCH